MSKELKECVRTMSQQMKNINKDTEIMKWDQIEILELKRNTKESPS